MTRLTITASPLIDRWSVTAADTRSRSAWPPSPDTLFSALVASAASLGNACHPSLYWLEALGNPAIETDLDAPRINGIQTFEPVADRNILHNPLRQERQHNSIGHPGRVVWSWEVDNTDHFSDLREIARNITYIGSSRAPVLAEAGISQTNISEGALVPAPGTGQRRLRGIYSGRLDELEAAHQRGKRPRPTQEVQYAIHGEERIPARWETIIPLQHITGQALHLSHSVPLAEALRKAITRHIPDGGPGALTGHGSGGRIAADHLAIIPMPRVDDDYADGRLFGAALVLPADISDADYQTLIAALGEWLSAGGAVNVGPVNWTMRIAQGTRPYSLQESRYRRAAATWATVTPVVFDRHPRRNLTLNDVIAGMCRKAGLPEPVSVKAMSHGPVSGALSSRCHSLGGRTYLRNRYTTHLRLGWSRPIAGPILLGQGQYFGLGVMIPADREAA